MTKPFAVAIRLALTATMVAFAIAPAPAAVMVRFPNRNLTVAYTDVSNSAGPEDYMKVERVYNSVTDFSGMFGFGWGTEQESNLLTRADGTLQYTAYGGGATTQLTPNLVYDASSAIPTILQAATQARMIGSNDESSTFVHAVDDDEQQFRQYTGLLKNGFLRPAEIGVGELFSGESYGKIRVVRVAEGYQMYKLPGANCARCSGFEGVFDRKGRLLRAWPSGAPERFVAYRYDDADRLSEMRDFRANAYKFKYDSAGHVVLMTTRSKASSQYKYDADGNLIWERDNTGNAFHYHYDSNHDLTEIDYPDKPPMRMTYPTHNGQLGSLVCSDGRSYTLVDVPGKQGTIEVTESRDKAVVKTYWITPDKYGGYDYCTT